jgi:hypothetical protein
MVRALKVEVHLVAAVHVDILPLGLLAREGERRVVAREQRTEQLRLVALHRGLARELAVVLADALELVVERSEDAGARHCVDLVAPRAVGVLVEGCQLHTLARVRAQHRGHHLVASHLVSTL